jgi:chromosome segregation ATPase
METTKQTKIQNIRNEMEKTHETIRRLSLELEHYESLLFEMENELRKSCDHNWVIDHQVFDIHSRSYICSKCGFTN